MRARSVIGSTLLVLCALLAACGEEQDGTKAGDIIKARLDDQFKEGEEATVTIPTGRLLIHADDPVDSASGDETRTRETVNAPAGAVLVPISWQYDPWDKRRLDGIVDSADTPIVALVSDTEHYRLPPPQLDDKGGESFYVVVGGDAEDRTLEIEFDGVTQSVDLVSGNVDKGDAAALYDIEVEALKKESCDEEPWFDGPTTIAEFRCDLSGPVLTPYAAGEWAPNGSLWLALTVRTGIRAYGETNGFGGGARYAATKVAVKPEIDGVAPAFTLTTDDVADACPAPVTGVCGWSKYLIFEVPADDGEQGPLDLEVSYRMRLAVAWGGLEAPRRIQVKAAEGLKLWAD